MRRPCIFPVVALGLLFAGCPDENGAPGDGGLPPIHVRLDAGGTVDRDAGVLGGDAGEVPPDPEALAEELCLAYRRGLRNLELAEAQQQALATGRCSGEDLLRDIATRPDLATLPQGTCTRSDALLRLFQDALEGGRVHIDRAAFRACIERGRALRASYDTVGEREAREAALRGLVDDPACEDAITPLVDEGGTCVHAWDCIAPLRCEANPLEDDTLRCLRPALEGARCVVTAPEGQESARTCAAGTACVLGICTRRIDEGQPCNGSSVPCVEGLVCSPEGTCAPPGGEGAACASDAHCEPDLMCGAEGTCSVEANGLDDGEPCTADGGPPQPCAELCSVCRPDNDGTRRCLDRGAEGAPCLTVNHCRAGLFCATASRTCAPFATLSEACGADHPCGPGLVCTDQPPPTLGDAGVSAEPTLDGGPAGPTCHARPGIGEPCQSQAPYRCLEGTCLGGACVEGVVGDPCVGDAMCVDDLLCLDGACTRPPRAGAPCSADGRCETEAFCLEGRCRPYPGPGVACAPNGRCEEGAFCLEGQCQALRTSGAPCPSDDACLSGLCLDTGLCAARAPSCYSTRAAFLQLLGLSLALPLLGALRRRRP